MTKEDVVLFSIIRMVGVTRRIQSSLFSHYAFMKAFLQGRKGFSSIVAVLIDATGKPTLLQLFHCMFKERGIKTRRGAGGDQQDGKYLSCGLVACKL